MMDISFVIPCYRSEKTISAVVEEIRNKMKELSKYSYEVILVNDCSPDNTFETIKSIAKEFDNVIAIDLAKNFGQHSAIMAGFSKVSGNIIVCLDDDGQTPANEVDKLLVKIEEGYDVVYAEYGNKQHSAFRNWGSNLNKKMTEILLGKPKELFISSYFAATRMIVEEIKRYNNPYPYLAGLVLRTTKSVCNVSVTHRQRMEGESGYSLRKLIGLWVNGFTAFSVLPLRMATYSGMLVALIGFIFAIWTVVHKIISPEVAVGWSSTFSVILVIGGMILFVLGMIGEYIGRIYISLNNSPQYVIREIVGKEALEGLEERTDH